MRRVPREPREQWAGLLLVGLRAKKYNHDVRLSDNFCHATIKMGPRVWASGDARPEIFAGSLNIYGSAPAHLR